MANINDSVYGRTSLADVFKEIHVNQKEKNRQIDNLIQQLSPLVKSINDASVIVPLIKEYLEVGVKNDEQLIKMTAVVQRLLSSEAKAKADSGINEWALTPDELKQIQNDLKGIQSIEQEVKETLSKPIKLS
jgi:hypothetical protein